ncbi:hypothetical protein ACA910_007671 [Epithemia clementina (nom. ined.)]
MAPSKADYRDSGNKAFKNGDWKKAISYYSKAIDLDDKDSALYSNRSAAYLKAGDNDNALKDAERCILLNPDFHKGYSRKGAALHAMKKYDLAVKCYRVGLQHCPKVEALEKGLASSNRAKNEFSKARTAARKSNAARKASTNQQKKADKASTVSSYVEQKRLELKLQKAALEAQLDFIDQLTQMSKEEKLELLFNVIDDDNNGYIDAKELASAMRRRNAEMSFTASLEKAIDMVAIFDTDGDARLNLDEFEGFLQVMLKELNVTFAEFAEYMVLQTQFSDTIMDDKNASSSTGMNLNGSTSNTGGDEPQIDEKVLAQQVKDRGMLLEMLADPRLIEIFDLFDKEGTRELGFKEVAIGLYQLTSDMEQSAKTTMELLLMMDKEDKRTVNYEQFGRLMMGVMSTLGHNKSFQEVADELVIALTTNTQISEADMASLLVADTVFTDFQTQQQQQQQNNVVDSISYSRLQKLFDLWDTNGDGSIDQNELEEGFAKFEQSSGAGINAHAEIKKQVFGAIFNKQQKVLERHLFAQAIAQYAALSQVDLHQLIDFMCVTAVLPADRAEAYSNAYKATYDNGNSAATKPMHLQYEFVDFD